MSWEGFKKNINRASTSILQKTGVVDKTIDTEYQIQEGRLKLIGGKVEVLHKEAKAYLDAVRSVSIGQERMSNITSLLPEKSTTTRDANNYKNIIESLSSHERHDFDEAFRASVVEPIARYGILFPECVDMAKKRESKLLDYDAARDRVRKCIDKPSRDAEKLPKLEAEEDEAKNAYETLNDLLIEGIPQMIDCRISLLEPSIMASITLQRRFTEEYRKKLDLISVKENYGNNNMEDTLAKMKNLSIFSV